MTKEYPMTYEEYEKRVIELFLERFDEKDREKALKRVKELLEADPDFISELYGDSCFRMTVLIFMGKIAKEHLKIIG